MGLVGQVLLSDPRDPSSTVCAGRAETVPPHQRRVKSSAVADLAGDDERQPCLRQLQFGRVNRGRHHLTAHGRRNFVPPQSGANRLQCVARGDLSLVTTLRRIGRHPTLRPGARRCAPPSTRPGVAGSPAPAGARTEIALPKPCRAARRDERPLAIQVGAIALKTERLRARGRRARAAPPLGGARGRPDTAR